jgi:hypothetical protein
MNTNLDNIKTAVDNNETNQANHTTGEGYKHQANQIEMPDNSSVEDAISALSSSISDLGDAANIDYTDGDTTTNLASIIASMQSAIEAIQAIMAINTDNVVISARAREIPGYLSIDASISPAGIAPRFWRAVISKKEGTGTSATVVELLTEDFTASRTKIPFDILPGVDVGNILYIKVYAFFSESDFVEANEQSITYQGYESPLVERVRNIEENITIPAFVAAAKEDPALITLLTNELQNSITLARNISEASAQ